MHHKQYTGFRRLIVTGIFVHGKKLEESFNMFIFVSAMSNYSGQKFDLTWINKIQEPLCFHLTLS